MNKDFASTTMRRWTGHHSVKPTSRIGLPPTHRAVVDGRTLFRSTVVYADESPRILVSGHNQRKIGKRVTKGKWAGMPIFCITLEERATCPRSCYHWKSCYGNGMPLARRHKPGQEFEYLLEQELAQKQQTHPNGFVVRLHILGDFYSIAYVARWLEWLALFPALNIFGYTAHPRSSDIGRGIDRLNTTFPSRVALRFSSQHPDTSQSDWATTIWRQPEAAIVPEGLVCPVQTDRTACCGTCALCWSTPKTIVFIAHGQKFNQQARSP
jgi:hypothetical protein